MLPGYSALWCEPGCARVEHRPWFYLPVHLFWGLMTTKTLTETLMGGIIQEERSFSFGVLGLVTAQRPEVWGVTSHRCTRNRSSLPSAPLPSHPVW